MADFMRVSMQQEKMKESTMDSPARITFGKGNEFQTALRKKVDAYFEKTGKSRQDNLEMYFKTAVILSWFVASYVLVVFYAQAWWQVVPLAISLGVSVAAIGFNIMHDGGHEAYSRFPIVNRIMARTLDLVGGSSYLWHLKHGVFHHTYTNITGYDNDVELGNFGRLSPHQKYRKIFRFQQFYLWPLYGVMAMKWHFLDDFTDLINGRIGPHKIARPKGKNLMVVIFGRIFFFIMAFAVPLVFHPLWAVALTYVVAAFVLGLTLSVVFQLAHCVEEAEFPKPPTETHKIETPWAVHQVETTVDFARNNPLATWLLGGLNFQVEHHLFPRICHVHYPAISKLVEETSAEFGIKYRVNPSVRAGIASHFRWMRRMGQAPVSA